MSSRQRDVHVYLHSARKKLSAVTSWRPALLSDDPERARQQREEREKRQQQDDYWALHSAVGDLHRAVELGYDQLETTLRRRGHLPIERGNINDLLVPFQAGHGELPSEQQRYLGLFGKRSFRKFARKLIDGRGEPVAIERLHPNPSTAAEYVGALAGLHVVEQLPEGVRLLRRIDNLGPTLEWYVAQICQRELSASAEWSVKLEGLTIGGDYDVLAWLDPLLMYVETKSAAPAKIDERQLRNFLQRTQELAPDLAVLLIDTESDLTSLLERLRTIITSELRDFTTFNEFVEHATQLPIRAQADYPGLSFGYRRVYVTNSEPSILTQLRRCLQHYHVHVKGVPLSPGPPINFVSGPVSTKQ